MLHLVRSLVNVDILKRNFFHFLFDLFLFFLLNLFKNQTDHIRLKVKIFFFLRYYTWYSNMLILRSTLLENFAVFNCAPLKFCLCYQWYEQCNSSCWDHSGFQDAALSKCEATANSLVRRKHLSLPLYNYLSAATGFPAGKAVCFRYSYSSTNLIDLYMDSSLLSYQ